MGPCHHKSHLFTVLNLSISARLQLIIYELLMYGILGVTFVFEVGVMCVCVCVCVGGGGVEVIIFFFEIAI